MFRSDWFLAATPVAILALAAYGLSIREHPTEQHFNTYVAPQVLTREIVDSDYVAYPDVNADDCYKARNHDAADLCAQWRAALAGENAAHEARRSTNWSIVATFLSSLAVIGLIVTIWQTRGALGEARRSNLIAQKANARVTRQAIASGAQTALTIQIAERNADAAQKAVDEATRIGEAQVRAYLSFKTLEVRREKDCCTIVLKVKNHGQSTAVICRIKCDVIFADSAKPFEERATSEPIGAGDIENLSPFYFDETINNNEMIVCTFEVEYRDVFNRKHKMVQTFGGPARWNKNFADSFSPSPHLVPAILRDERRGGVISEKVDKS